MSDRPVTRVVILGLDALVPTTVERFAREGGLATLRDLIGRGCFSRLRSVFPPQTPTNWATIATGATPGTHGIVQWGSHLPGEPVWETHREEAFNAGLCQAEYLWEAVARQGGSSVVMNYAGYPPTTDRTVHIDRLFQPMRSYYDLAPACVDTLTFAQAEGWTDLPSSTRPPLEATIEIETSTPGTGPTLHVLLYSRSDAYDSLAIAPSNSDRRREEIRVGEFTGWINCMFDTADQGRVEGALRIKLLDVDADGSSARVFRSDAFPIDGRICSDARVSASLARLGPYVHAGKAVDLHRSDLLDLRTVQEVLADEAVWWSSAAAIAAEETNARLVILHWHVIDMIGHTFVPLVDPSGTDYDPATEPEHWETIGAYYEAADRFVKAFIDRFDDGETALVVVSDHGMPANRRAVSLINEFRDRGWVSVSEDGASVDWSRSKVFFTQGHLWINLEGRDEGGIVPESEYAGLRDEVIGALRDLKDPETGQHVLAFALSREHAPAVGLWGDYIGDVVLCYEDGYRWTGPEVLQMDEGRAVFPCGGANHGPMMPTYETDATSNMGCVVMCGPGIRSGVRLRDADQPRLCTTDIAPTVARLLGIDPPAQSEGRVIREFFENTPSAHPNRVLQSTARPLRAQAPDKPVLQGDFTDEV